MNELQSIKALLNGLAEYYRTELSPQQLSMYAEDLIDLGPESVGRAIVALRRNPQQKFMPLPAEIREYIIGSVNDMGVDVANRIVEAISKYGYTNWDRAKAFIGEIGVHVVQREGGWQSLCERVRSNDIPTLKAQWREMAKVAIRGAQMGHADRPPALPRADEPALQAPMSITKLLEKR